MSWGALACSSPSTFGPTTWPSAIETARSCTPGIARPSVWASFSSGSRTGAMVRMGASVSPHPEMIPCPPISRWMS